MGRFCSLPLTSDGDTCYAQVLCIIISTLIQRDQCTGFEFEQTAARSGGRREAGSTWYWYRRSSLRDTHYPRPRLNRSRTGIGTNLTVKKGDGVGISK